MKSLASLVLVAAVVVTPALAADCNGSHALDRCLSAGSIGHFHEAEAFASSCVAVHDHLGGFHLPIRSE